MKKKYDLRVADSGVKARDFEHLISAAFKAGEDVFNGGYDLHEGCRIAIVAAANWQIGAIKLDRDDTVMYEQLQQLYDTARGMVQGICVAYRATGKQELRVMVSRPGKKARVLVRMFERDGKKVIWGDRMAMDAKVAGKVVEL